MNTSMIDSYSSTTTEQSEPVTKLGTSVTGLESKNPDEIIEEQSTETKPGKRKRSVKKANESNISSDRPRRTLTKREELSIATVNGTPKTKLQHSSAEQTIIDGGDEQEREKRNPIVHDVADIVWVKIGGHPWWPSLVVRDPNDETRCFTKISGNTRTKRIYFVVFYGSTADFAWVSDAAIVTYQGVEAFTKYAQDMVDKAQTKSQKEQLTERFQLKVTIGRREDWEMAVREADEALKHTSEKRLEEIQPKIQFYTSKITISKVQSTRKSKSSTDKTKTITESSMDPNNRSLLAEKTFEFKSEDDLSNDESSMHKTSSAVKIKVKKQKSNETNSLTTPSAKRHSKEIATVFGQTINGLSVSYQQRTSTGNDNSTGKKRGRPRLSKPSIITANGEIEKSEATKNSTQKTSITKSQATNVNMSHSVSSLNNILVGQHHRFDTRVGFLSPFEEQEIFDAIDQLRSTKTFEEAEQIAKHRFEHILCVNLNKTHVNIPQEWFYLFLFAHPILIVKNPHWFTETKSSDLSIDNDMNRMQSSNSLQVLKYQLSILSKLYRNELQVRQPSANTSSLEKQTI